MGSEMFSISLLSHYLVFHVETVPKQQGQQNNLLEVCLCLSELVVLDFFFLSQPALMSRVDFSKQLFKMQAGTNALVINLVVKSFILGWYHSHFDELSC